MSWGLVLVGIVGLLAGALGGAMLMRLAERARLARLARGVSELASGNYAHRVLIPGSGGFSRIAEDLNRLADAVQAEREEASSRDEARRRFVANISHDLRTPITSVAGYVDALQRGLGDQPDRYLAIIGAKADELVQLTDDLFYSARLDADDLELVMTRVDLAEAVRRSVLGFEPELAARDVSVDLVIPEEPGAVEADSSAVGRILSNLISNSVRHGDTMTTFGVTMSASDADYVVRVSNNGSRLPAESDRLFERGVAGPGGGAGLGLSIARELAERMGATVSADNLAEGGVAFTLVFPRPRS